jgi:hypothetical protein
MKLSLYKCSRCGYEWASRKSEPPRYCANKKCRSPYWNVPRGQKRGRPKKEKLYDLRKVRKEFQHRLKAIVDELIHARGYIRVWEQLWPSTEQVARVINRYRHLFGYTRMALNQQFLLSLAKVVEQRAGKENVSIWRLINIIENTPELLEENINVNDLKQKLSEKQEILKRIIKYRDKVIAHIDDKYVIGRVLDKEANDKIEILLGDVKALQDELEDIVNKISIAYNRVHQEFLTLDHEDTTHLINDTIKWIYRE